MTRTTPRRRVRNFTIKARQAVESASWPDGVKVEVGDQSQTDAIHVFTPGGGARTFWALDPYDLASADPATVRKTAIRRLVSQGRDPRFTQKSRAEDMALADLLRGGPCDHPDAPDGTLALPLVRCPDCLAILLDAGPLS